MITPDILVVQPLHLDFPLWRCNMVKYKDYFRSLTIVFSNHYQEKDYSNFIRVQLPFAKFVEYKGDKADWRNGAVNAGLDSMPDNGYVLFMEQDFFWKDEKFLKTVFSINEIFGMPPINVITFSEDRRTHPAFAVVKREIVNKTRRDFSAVPPQGDHFHNFFNDIFLGEPGKRLYNLSGGTNYTLSEMSKIITYKEDYYHLNGLSQNYHNYKLGELFYQEDQFLAYNDNCRYLPIENHPEFYQIELAIRMKFGKGDEEGFIKNFFPAHEHTE